MDLEKEIEVLRKRVKLLEEFQELKKRVEELEKYQPKEPVYIPCPYPIYPEPFQPYPWKSPWYGTWTVTGGNCEINCNH